MCNPVTIRHPEHLLVKGLHRNLEWEVTHNGMAFRCGYVRIPHGHPWHGMDYGTVPADVHGHLTFAEPDLRCGMTSTDDAWWLGFDCAHTVLGDAPDPELPGYNTLFARMVEPPCSLRYGRSVRTTEYVVEQCRALCEQAEAAT